MSTRHNPLHHNKPPKAKAASNSDLAADIIRHKIDILYSDEDHEPDTVQELDEVKSAPQRSTHQEFMYQLSTSGRSPGEIQAAWHNYYTNLPDDLKHEVWQEFYAAQGPSNIPQAPFKSPAEPATTTPKGTNSGTTAAAAKERAKLAASAGLDVAHKTFDKLRQTAEGLAAKSAAQRAQRTDGRSVSDIKAQLLSQVNKRGKLSKKHHVQSLFFGLGIGGLVMLVLMFSFFNERIIAPFIRPSSTVSDTPIIIDPGNGDTTDPAYFAPKIIVPKINIEIPVVYDQPSVAEKDLQASLENGAVHYATTPSPGEQGNAVILGHSSSNILNNGKYKFAFVLLNRLQVDDTFMLTKGGKRYVYKIYERKIVKPTEVSVLGPASRPSTATLITCDPPGTAVNRLIIVGEQISPKPTSNTASTATKPPASQPTKVPGDSPSLWQRIFN